MAWNVFLVLALTLSIVEGKGNVDTSSFQRLNPPNPVKKSEFGASLAIQSSPQSKILFVGAPHYSSSNATVPEGTVFSCLLDSNHANSCSPMTFGRSGSMGMSMGFERRTNELTVCGNQYAFTCEEGNQTTQRLIGSCFVGTKPLSTPCDTECVRREAVLSDLIFLLDDSGSVTEPEFNQQLNWTTELLRNFTDDINNGRVKVGILVFNSVVRVEISLNNSLDYSQLITLILGILKEGGSTNIGRAMGVATGEFFEYGRKNVTQAMIVLTDGGSNDNETYYSQQARDLGIITIAVGVGDGYEYSKLLEVAGNESQIFEATDYSSLGNITEGLLSIITDSATIVLEGQVTNTSTLLTQCQAGTSLHISEDSLYVGAVGAYTRAGSVFDYGEPEFGLRGFINETDLEHLIQPVNISDFRESYLGYSTTSGKFSASNVLVASGAPGYRSKGIVLIYDPDNLQSNAFMLHPLKAELWQIGAYFGHSVVGADLNNDSYDDLIVSSPLYTDGFNSFDQGRVFIFWNNPNNSGMFDWMTSDYSPTILIGSNRNAARFGYTVVVGGDIDQNGYDDIIIGAPYEELTAESSGVVYVYFLTEQGVTDQRTQRIVGTSVASGLQRFGTGLLHHENNATDIDGNGYPDVVVSATLSNDVIVLFSRPVVVITTLFTNNTPSIVHVIDCLRNRNQSCVRVEILMSAEEASRSMKAGTNFGLKIRISLDSLVTEEAQKRLFFADNLSSEKDISLSLNSSSTLLSYDVLLNANVFNNLDSNQLFDASSRINVSWALSSNESGVEAPLLDTFETPWLDTNVTFRYNCTEANQVCLIDLVATPNYSIPESTSPHTLEDRPSPFVATISVTNRGPDPAQFLRMNVSSNFPLLNRVSGNCVELVDDTSGVAHLSISFPSESALSSFIFPEQVCQFQLSYSLELLAQEGIIQRIEISGILYSGANESRWNETDESDNVFAYSQEIRYTAGVTVSRTSEPSTVRYNRTENNPLALSSVRSNGTETTVGSLLDPILGGAQTNIKHLFTISNTGPHTLAQTNVTITWPAALNSSLDAPLLYLYDFQCLVGQTVNPFNLSLSDDSSTDQLYNNVSVAFPAALNFTDDVTCSDVYCSQIFCTFTAFRATTSVSITSLYKVWLPTFTQSNFSSSLSSSIVLDTSISQQIFDQVSVMVSLYTPPPIIPPPTDNTLILILGIAGGVVGLLIIIGIMWKLGFFESKYAKMKQEAIERDDADSLSHGQDDPDTLSHGQDDPDTLSHGHCDVVATSQKAEK